uniref:NADH-ubiquinone oxidoreductase chain 2 n=1 Tax=Metschnikowia agaves TaxID=56417 RepID=A0A7D7FWH5_9ASCO|nr:Nad2 [Metschnikowia agaves]QMQ98502.1 Nad2 [Metschnikowia agaves]QMQ98516.1 Nad2 [Metschnikowia agaves]
MLFTSFLTLLVFSTYNMPYVGHTIMLNRLGLMTMGFMLMLLMMTMDMMGLMPGMTLYNNWFNMTSNNMPLMMLMLMLMMMLLMYNTYMNKYKMMSPYFMMMVLANLMGLMTLPMVNDLLVMYMMMELQSYSLYLLTGLHNRSFNASRASLLYFMMGGMASTIMLLASYFMYNLTGTTNLSDMIMINNYNNNEINNYFNMLLMALLFKMGLAPLHRWSMAVYNYAPTYMTAYISIVAKLSMISWIYIHSYFFDNYILMIFMLMSLIMGSYKPLYQINIKIMLAYSGMLNFSYILLSIVTYDLSLYIYLMQYSLTHIMMFLMLLSLGEYMDKPMSKWSPMIYINQLKLPNLTLAMCFILALFSLIGMPPLPGFYAKLFILSGALLDNYIYESLLLILCSVMATYYYANMIKMLFNSKTTTNMSINSSLAYSMAISTMLMISFYIYLPYLSEGLYLMTI